jgi:hypothetical protein
MNWRALIKPAAAAVVATILVWIAFGMDQRVPLLAMFDLGIHELGHLVFRPFGIVMSFLMGSGLQILVPFGLATYFWVWQKDRVSAGLLMAWGATSMQDVSVYIADAPYRSLQLIGGTHDWWWLLGRWGRIDQAEGIADTVWMAGLLLGLAAIGLILVPVARQVWDWMDEDSATTVAGPSRVREARRPAEEI